MSIFRILELGLTVVNLWPKTGLSGNGQKTFLPTTFGLGLSYTKIHSENGNQFTVAIDASQKRQ